MKSSGLNKKPKKNAVPEGSLLDIYRATLAKHQKPAVVFDGQLE